jgi:hypothetical protein
MTPRKAIRISTPTPEELQVLYDLPSETPEVEDSLNTKPTSPDEADPALRCNTTLQRLHPPHEADRVECYNKIIRSTDALFDAAGGGSDDAAKFLRTLAGTAVILGGHFV